MPRGNLTERYVQRIAVRWLEEHYQRVHQLRAIFAKMELAVRARVRIGYGRTDGLVIAKLEDGSVLTAVLEAKSSRTLFNVSRWYRVGRRIAHTLAVALLMAVFVKALTPTADDWFTQWGLSVMVLLVVGFLFIIITHDHHYYQEIDVIRQVKRYPANERWVALSTDAYNQLGRELQQALHTACKRSGVGLLRVSPGGKVKLLESPQAVATPKGYTDFLFCYAREQKLRQILDQIEAENMLLPNNIETPEIRGAA